MKQFFNFILTAVTAGALVVLPIYVVALLLLKASTSAVTVVRPIASLLPEEIPAEHALSLLLVLIVFFLVGVVIRTSAGRTLRDMLERTVFGRIPGYALLRSATHRVGDERAKDVWKPALVEIEEALVPAFVVEECGPGQVAVFVPAAPTPLSGAIYILDRGRVHPLDVPVTRVIRSISKWGAGSQELVGAMRRETHRS